MSLSCRTRSKTKRNNENAFAIPTDQQFASEEGTSVQAPPKKPTTGMLTRKNSRQILGNSKIYDISAVMKTHENANIDNNSVETKEKQTMRKISLSKEEKEMNGAPVGDIYEVNVFDDKDLKPYKSQAEARSEMLKHCDTLNESTGWAEKHDIVVVIRRVALYHHEVLENVEEFIKALGICCEMIESLRSYSIKNGILCMSAILRECHGQNCDENSEKIIGTLLNRTASGPRFICDMANDLLHQAVSNRYISTRTFIEALAPFVHHKNGDVTCRAFILSSKCIMLLDASLLDQEDSVALRENVVNILHMGLNSSKRAKGRESTKDACIYLHGELGGLGFETTLLKCLNISQVGEMYRLICQIDRTKTFEALMVQYEKSQENEEGRCRGAEVDRTREIYVSRSGGEEITMGDGLIVDRDGKEKFTSPLRSAAKRNSGNKSLATQSAKSSRSGGKNGKTGQASSFKQHIQMMKKQQKLLKKKPSSKAFLDGQMPDTMAMSSAPTSVGMEDSELLLEDHSAPATLGDMPSSHSSNSFSAMIAEASSSSAKSAMNTEGRKAEASNDTSPTASASSSGDADEGHGEGDGGLMQGINNISPMLGESTSRAAEGLRIAPHSFHHQKSGDSLDNRDICSQSSHGESMLSSSMEVRKRGKSVEVSASLMDTI